MRRLTFAGAAMIAACAQEEPACAPAGWVSEQRSAWPVLADGTETQLLMPGGLGRYPDGTPAIVYVRGGWNPLSLPAQSTLPVPFGTGRGVAQVYLDLPEDARGEDSRQAVGAALRFAAGEEADADGCTLSDWMDGPLSGQLVVVGYSNGGNLAWSTLADPDVSLPAVHGIVTFETPAAAEFVLFDALRTDYTAGSCVLDDGLGISCPLSYDALRSAPNQDALYLDRDEDGRLGEGDALLGTLVDPLTGTAYPTPAAAAAAEAAGLELWSGLSVDEVRSFWSPREAPRQMAAAAARFPGLAAVVAATEEDHALDGLPDAAHVTGMLAAAEAAGVAWHRLNPDASYAVLETGDPSAAASEWVANTAFGLGDGVTLMPESVGAGRGLLTAAAVELLDRSHESEWSDDLEQVLFR